MPPNDLALGHHRRSDPLGTPAAAATDARGLPARARVGAVAVFACSYTSWRPLDVLFTYSDGLFIVAILLSLRDGRLALRPFGALTPAWHMAMMLVLAGLLAGSLTASEADRWLIAGAQYAFSFLLLPMLMAPLPARQWLALTRSLIFGVVAMELFGIAIYFGYHASFEQYQRFGVEFITGEGRLGAFLGDANWNAAVIALALPFVLFLRRRRQLGALTTMLATAVLLTALVLTASVTGIACVVGGSLVFAAAARAWPSPRMVALVLAIAALLATAGSQLPHAFQRRIGAAVAAGDVSQVGTLEGRMTLIREAWQMAAGTTVIGVGTDRFRRLSVERAPVHNILLLLWTEGGAASLLGWIGLNLVAVAGGLLAMQVDRAVGGLALATVAVFIIFSNAAPHMYARVWIVPVLLAIGPAFAALDPSHARAEDEWPALGPSTNAAWPRALRSGPQPLAGNNKREAMAHVDDQRS